MNILAALVETRDKYIIIIRQACLEEYKRNREPNIGELLERNTRICEIKTFLRNIGTYDLI